MKTYCIKLIFSFPSIIAEFNDTLLVFVCIWILIVQTTIARPMASSHQVDQVIIRGRSQRISDQADTAISQLKVFFANYVS